MRNHGRDLVQLCESWWDQTSHAESELRSVAESFLECLGWRDWESFPIDAGLAAHLGGPENNRLAAVFFLPGRLEPSSKVVERGLDYSRHARRAVASCADHGADFVLVTDLCRAYLYEIGSDELLLHADSPELFLREIFDEVTSDCVMGSELTELPGPPRSTMARRLREWQDAWRETLVNGREDMAGPVETLMDQLIVTRYLYEGGVHPPDGNALFESFEGLLRADEPERAAARWNRLCHTLCTRHRMPLFQPNGRLLRLTTEERRLADMFSEFGRMSRSKFEIPCILESFNAGEAAEKARVRLVPEPDPERDKAIASQALDTLPEFKLEVDVVDEGYRAIGHWFTQIVGVYRRLGVPVRTVPLRTPAQGELEFPTDEPEEDAAGRDALVRAVEDNLCLYVSNNHQRRVSRLLLHLYVGNAYRRHGAALGRFPDVDRAIADRPTFSQREKDWIYNPNREPASGDWET